MLQGGYTFTHLGEHGRVGEGDVVEVAHHPAGPHPHQAHRGAVNVSHVIRINYLFLMLGVWVLGWGGCTGELLLGCGCGLRGQRHKSDQS
jgi:hypothetical protein